jgi:large subunit ribosomal protein L21e
MPHAYGLKARSRYIFSKAFRTHGHDPLSRYLTVYKIGDYVDIIGDGSKHRGMPNKIYHGKTGKVFDVTHHALGIIVNKRVRNNILHKKLHVRVEHVRQSKSRISFIARMKMNEKLKKEAKLKKEFVQIKRKPEGPSEEQVVKGKKEFMNYKPFVELF